MTDVVLFVIACVVGSGGAYLGHVGMGFVLDRYEWVPRRR